MNDYAQLVEDWQQLLESERRIFDQYLLVQADYDSLKEEKHEAACEWWKIVNAIIWMHVRAKAQLGLDLIPQPFEILGKVANIAEELSNGIVPEVIENARHSGGRPLFRAERQHIGYAVLYVEAAKSGFVRDRSPNKTVREAYDVTAKTVQNWYKRRDELRVGVPHAHLTPEELKEMMMACGRLYTRLGRGTPST